MEVVFTLLFSVEACLKIVAFQKAYFKDNWNRFDFVVVRFDPQLRRVCEVAVHLGVGFLLILCGLVFRKTWGVVGVVA